MLLSKQQIILEPLRRVQMVSVNLMKGDCLERMKSIPDGSIDLILTDPPYIDYPKIS